MSSTQNKKKRHYASCSACWRMLVPVATGLRAGSGWPRQGQQAPSSPVCPQVSVARKELNSSSQKRARGGLPYAPRECRRQNAEQNPGADVCISEAEGETMVPYIAKSIADLKGEGVGSWSGWKWKWLHWDIQLALSAGFYSKSYKFAKSVRIPLVQRLSQQPGSFCERYSWLGERQPEGCISKGKDL